MSYLIEFCGNCRVGHLTKEMNPCACDQYAPCKGRRCQNWQQGHYLHHDERVVYICSPCRPRYTGDLGEKELQINLRNAEAYSYAAVVSHAVPIAPHLLFTRFLDEFNPSHRNIAIEMGGEVLKRCDELWVFGDRITEGMQAEIDAAERLKMPIIKISQEQADEIIAAYQKGENNG